MNRRIQLACVWCGPIGVVGYLICFAGLAHFLPPSHPTWSADRTAQFYVDHRDGIRAGMIGGMVFATLLLVFFASISRQIAAIEKDRFPILAILQLAGAILLTVFFYVCSMLWIVASFRADYDPGVVRTLHDAGWLVFVMVFPEYCLMMLCMAAAAFMDKRPNPTWPRWAGYGLFWVSLSGMGGGLAVFFKHGAFAWNGLIGFWAPISIFVIWLGISTWLLRAAVLREPVEVEEPVALAA
ncbi:MAG: hypothetical protein QOF76_4063 [Solirubrobacteraceae bacterium]|jgi:hypothetical protein|nr:hypothetical protein [Solirubrobacteraceae bacterium]